MSTPYNTGKVRIGLAHTPRRQLNQEPLMDRLQDSLLRTRADIQEDMDGLWIAVACLLILGIPTLLWWFR